MTLEPQIHDLIDRAIQEDIRLGDLTTTACIPENAQASAKIILKQAGVVAGLPFLETLFRKINRQIQVKLEVQEGSFQKAGAIIGIITGPMRGILSGERVALNLIQHASGVATVTSSYVKKIAGTHCAIMDTRKTLPGLRALEKYAVRIGGGQNHRLGLDDRLIIKSNHISYLQNHSNTPLGDTIGQMKKKHPHLSIEIEVDEYDRLQEILATETDAIMLVNMTTEEAKKCVEKMKNTKKKVYIESGGTITLDTVRAYAETGVHGICIGDLTHSVQALDIRMRLI